MEFTPPIYPGPERAYHGYFNQLPAEARLEQPIFPIKELGTTIPLWDPAGRYPTIIHQAQALIKAGVGKLQLVMTGGEAGRPRWPGKEMREQLKELGLASDAMFTGIEMPAYATNVTGLAEGRFSDEARARRIQEVKDAIRLAADIADGGHVDMVSLEFPRGMAIAPWNEGEAFVLFPGEKERMDIPLVDTKTGAISWLSLSEKIPLTVHPITGEPFRTIKEGKEVFEVKMVGWPEFEQFAKELAEKRGINWQAADQKTRSELLLDTVQEIWKGAMQRQIDQAKSLAAQDEMFFVRADLPRMGRIEIGIPPEKIGLKELFDNFSKLTKEQQEILKKSPWAAGWLSQQRAIAEFEARKETVVPLAKVGRERAIEGYAELGIAAMDETHARRLKRELSVGPEIGRPEFYGGHPDEWLELIRGARKRMAEKLVERGIPEDTAQELAKRHIKGTLDVGHIGWWLAHFRPDLPYEERIKEFNKWFLKKTEEIAKANEEENFIDTVQLVDAAAAEHGHLPPGQGIFPVIEAGKILAKHGFAGNVVSEGHEEERWGEGRIFLKTWEAFGGQVPAGYFMGPPRRWADVHQGYFGKTYAPTMMTGAYTLPFMGYQPWSELPFE